MAGYGQMMKQMNKLQRDMEKKQAELDAREFVKSANAGMITITAMGNKEIKSITIADEMMTVEDKELLEDMLILAVNDLIKEIEEVSEKELGKLTNGMKMPGLF